MEQVDPCCDPDSSGGLSPASSEEMAATFKALADPVRLRLLSIIATIPEGEVCACDLYEPLERSQATVSHHLSILVKAGLITREQRGKWAWFRVAPHQSEFVTTLLRSEPTVTPA